MSCRISWLPAIVSDYCLIESTPNGYQINPTLNIITDLQLFDNKWNLALKTTANEDKIELLQKLVDLYGGDVLHSASSEHWLVGTSLNYQYRYMGAVNELMKILWEGKRYHHINTYAAKAMAVVPHNADVHYWLIRTMCKQGHSEMARSEIRMAENFVTVISNPALFTPTIYLSPEILEYEGHTIIHVYVPPSAEVHSYKKVIYDRVNDADVKVTATTQIAQMYIRKQSIFTEQRIYPYAAIDDLRTDLLPRIRQMAVNHAGGSHPWENMTDDELLRSAGLYGRDVATGLCTVNLQALMWQS